VVYFFGVTRFNFVNNFIKAGSYKFVNNLVAENDRKKSKKKVARGYFVLLSAPIQLPK
jgi:hypothetical protein